MIKLSREKAKIGYSCSVKLMINDYLRVFRLAYDNHHHKLKEKQQKYEERPERTYKILKLRYTICVYVN